MTGSLKTLLKLAAASAAMVFVAGCASQASGDMESRLDQAMEMASDAQTTANEADSKAESAMTAASEAREMAAEAEGQAESAQQTADQNSEKIDRMFKKSMMK